MRVLIRADGHQTLGGGHVMRQLALAGGLMERGDSVWLVSTRLDPGLQALAEARGVPVLRYDAESASPQDARLLSRLVHEHRADWVIFDGYEFDTQMTSAARDAGARTLLIDDFMNRDRYHGRILLNQNGASSLEPTYRERGFNGRLLLGPSYALLRSEFRSVEPTLRPVPKTANHLLVTMGSADAARATELVLEALQLETDPSLKADVVIGAANPRGLALRRRFPDPRLVWHDAVRDMSALMQKAELAVGAAGVTSLELSCLGVPAMLMVLADNQELLAQSTSESGAAIDLGWHHALAPERLAKSIASLRGDQEARQRMRDAGRNRVDGRGVDRVIAVMREETKA